MRNHSLVYLPVQRHLVGLLLVLPLLVAGLSGCTGKADKRGEAKAPKPDHYPDFHYRKDDILAPPTSATAALPVDIYLDATFSMRGFAQPQTTNFSRLLEGIEGAVRNAAKSSNVRFFKYGRSVAPLDREAFAAARHSSALWDDLDFRSKTNFSQAVDSTDPKRVSIFITDLFYGDGDFQNVVNAIQSQCFAKGVEMGLLGLKSEFDGKVGDLPGDPVPVKGERPLYAVVFGSKDNIQLIFRALQNQPYMTAGQALLLTHFPVRQYTVTATNTKGSRAVKKSSERKAQIGSLDNAYAYFWDADKGAQGSVDYRISFEPEPYALPINPSNLKALIFRRDASTGKDSVVDDQSLRLVNVAVRNGQISGQAQVTPKIPEGGGKKPFVAYQILWQYDNLGRVELPRWIAENSTQNFGIGHDETKTYKLDDLVRSLAVSAATQFEPRYGKLYLTFVRQ